MHDAHRSMDQEQQDACDILSSLPSQHDMGTSRCTLVAREQTRMRQDSHTRHSVNKRFYTALKSCCFNSVHARLLSEISTQPTHITEKALFRALSPLNTDLEVERRQIVAVGLPRLRLLRFVVSI